jgi:hypothetical protein
MQRRAAILRDGRFAVRGGSWVAKEPVRVWPGLEKRQLDGARSGFQKARKRGLFLLKTGFFWLKNE